MKREGPYKSDEDFIKAGGIIHPIRAIVRRDLCDFDKVATIVADIELALHMLDSNSKSEYKCGKKMWANLINKSNIIGYFSAIKVSDTEIRIGYSLCKPIDWPNFNNKIGKSIAINKTRNISWIVDGGEDHCNFWLKQKLMMRDALLNRHVSSGVIRGKKEPIVFLMLGTLSEQLLHFIRRVERYYKFEK